MEQLISHIRTALVDTIASQDIDGGVIPVQEVLKFLTKIHDILENAVCKEVGNTVHILVSLFNSASRQCHKVLRCGRTRPRAGFQFSV